MKRNDQSDKLYTLAEKIGFKQSGLLPLGFNEHTQILRSEILSKFSVDQSIKLAPDAEYCSVLGVAISNILRLPLSNIQYPDTPTRAISNIPRGK